MNFYHSKILLSILQQKLCHEIQEDWKFEINDIKKTLLVCVRVHDFSSKCANDEKCSLYWHTVRQALSNWSENIMKLIDISVLWSIVRVVTTSKTVYNNSLKFFTQLVSRLQVCNLWVTQHTQKVKRNSMIITEDSIWSMTLDELLKIDSYIYISHQ